MIWVIWYDDMGTMIWYDMMIWAHMAIWAYGHMAIWAHGHMAIWHMAMVHMAYGHMAIWAPGTYGHMMIWAQWYDDMGTTARSLILILTSGKISHRLRCFNQLMLFIGTVMPGWCGVGLGPDVCWSIVQLTIWSKKCRQLPRFGWFWLKFHSATLSHWNELQVLGS